MDTTLSSCEGEKVEEGRGRGDGDVCGYACPCHIQVEGSSEEVDGSLQ